MATANRTHKKPGTTPAIAPTYYMVATAPGPGEVREFLSVDNYHHDRPDNAPTAITRHPAFSPLFASRAHAERGAARFPGLRWHVLPEQSALMECSAILSVIAASGLPGEYDGPYGDSFGRFVAEPAGRADGSIRVTFSDNRTHARSSSLLHEVHAVLGRIYRAKIESRQMTSYSLTLGVLVTGIIPVAVRD